MNGRGKSDRTIVPMEGPGPSEIPPKQPEAQKAKISFCDFCEEVASRAEALRERARVLGLEIGEDGIPFRTVPANQTDWTLRHVRAAKAGPEGLQQALERIRQAARRDKGLKFTSLWHHVYQIDRLREAYLGLKRQAAPGEDHQTWDQYGQHLEENLQDLSKRLATGRYHARPALRGYVPKLDGKQRPIGIPVLEDKIVQRATVSVLNAVYEEDFQGFSYGFRPGRNCHMALDALAVGIQHRKVSYLLDADIRSFFDTLSHECLVKFVEHRIADRRVIRHIRKWLNAGVMEDGKHLVQEDGVSQGGSASPLLANIYLHYVFDLWAEQWRRRHARGEVIIVRYADDFVVGFQYQSDAEQFHQQLRERLQQFNLELHAQKTRVIEFGRFATERRSRQGKGKPETFNFLGFTHVCDRTRDGRFIVLRRTMAKRMRIKLLDVKQKLRKRLHRPIREVGRWLGSVLRGYMQYHAVPRNLRAVSTFRYWLTRLWRSSIRHRSQKGKVIWERMARLVRRWLPMPRVCHPYPSNRPGVMI